MFQAESRIKNTHVADCLAQKQLAGFDYLCKNTGFYAAALILVIWSWVNKSHRIITPIADISPFHTAAVIAIKGFLKTANITGNALAYAVWLTWRFFQQKALSWLKFYIGKQNSSSKAVLFY